MIGDNYFFLLENIVLINRRKQPVCCQMTHSRPNVEQVEGLKL